MALEIRQNLKLTQTLIMTQKLQQAIKLLQLSRLELLGEIHQVLETNPVLEESQIEEKSDLQEPEILPFAGGGEEVSEGEASNGPEAKSAAEEWDWDSYLQDRLMPTPTFGDFE